MFLLASASPPSATPQSGSTKKNIDPRRFYSALVFIPLLYVGIRHTPAWLFALLLSLVSLFALWEFLNLLPNSQPPRFLEWTMPLAAAGIMGGMNYGVLEPLYPWLVGITLIILCGFFSLPSLMKQYMTIWTIPGFGLLYIPLLLGHFILLRQMEHGIELIFFVILVTWLADTGGFVVGLAIGKHPLAPTLSPKKTIEGLFGGVAFATIGAGICQIWFSPFFSLGQCAMLGISLALIGAIGDLCESGIKRSVQVKDSGTIIPGHGGVLDRVDSLLLTGPSLYYYLLLYPVP